MRDDRPFGGADPAAVLFRCSRDRSGVHPVEHLKTFDATVQRANQALTVREDLAGYVRRKIA